MLKHFMPHFINRIFHSRFLFVLTLMVIFYGLFLVPGSDQTSRLWREISNLGHIAAFLIMWTFVFNLFPRLRQFSILQVFVVVLVSTLVVAELIEIVQGWIGRDDEWQDVWDSGVGALLAIAFCSTQVRELARWARRTWRVVALISLLVVPWTIWSNLADEMMLRRQFPVLCDFSTPFELSRWNANKAKIQLQRSDVTGHSYLAVKFQPALYSTISLKYFYPDWRNYRHIVLDLTNPDATELHIVLRMHDDLHKKYRYVLNDRYNHVLILKPGHQQISIPILDVENAPATRKMDLQHMEDISLFTMQSRSYHHLFIHRIYLE